MNKFGLFFFLLVFFGCELEKEINIDLPLEADRLIIFGFFSPATAVEVKVYQTVSPTAIPSNTSVSNATVMLIEDGIIVDTLELTDERYVSNYLTKKNKGYQIKVEAENFPTAISSLEFIPDKSSIIKINRIQDTSGVRLLVDLNNFPNQNTFWDIETDAFFGENADKIEDISKVENITDSGLQCDFLKDDKFSNSCFNKDIVNISLKVGSQKVIFNNDGTVDFIPYHKYTVLLKTLSASYFEYYKNIDRYLEAEGEIFREIPLTWTNIENGYGVFAGFDYDTVEFIP